MPKFYFLILLLSIVFSTACSKSQRQNRRIEGMWYERYRDDVKLSEENKREWRFTKEKRGKGKVTIIYFDYTKRILNYEYEISHERLWLRADDLTNENFKIVKLTKKEMHLEDTDGVLRKFVPKYP